MVGDSVAEIVQGLADDEKTLLEELPRIAKSDRNNTFFESQLERRKKCFEMEVRDVLKALSNRGLVSFVGGSRWRTTPLGRKVSHAVFDDMMSKKYPSLTIRK